MKHTKGNLSGRLLLLLHCIPFPVIAMWLDFSGSPAGERFWQLLMTAVPLGVLAALCGSRHEGKVFLAGCQLSLIADALALVWLLFLEKSGGTDFLHYFHPVNAVVVLLIFYVVLLFIQCAAFGLAFGAYKNNR